MKYKLLLLKIFIIVIISCLSLNASAKKKDNKVITVLRENALNAHKAFYRSQWHVNGWFQHCDSTTGLIPRNLSEALTGFITSQ